ncbi:MAG: FAD-dependent monooxygenase [Hyphomicrobiales bacterium]
MSGTHPLTIVGAGIAGLTTALSLHQRGIASTIIEKRPSLADEGAGIQITPNAFHVLAGLGLGDVFKQRAHATQAVTLRVSTTHREIVQMPLGEPFAKRHDAPYLVVHRADLMAILHQACKDAGIPIHFGETLDEQTDTPIIGADGVWSTTRQRIGKVEAQFSNRIAFRSIIDAENGEAFDKTHDVTVTFGSKAHFIYYPIKGGKQLNMVCIVQGAKIDNRWSAPATSSEVLANLPNWSQPIKTLIKRTDDWQRWPLFTVAPESPWTNETTALIGDAAHAMVPFVAQGGAMAIEDAAVLAHAIATQPNTSTAFKAYEVARKERVTKVWHEAMANGKRYHMSGLPALARNMALKTLGGERMAQRYNWIYDWRAPV